MPWQMNERERQTVLALSGERRYAYFIKRVADWQEVWSLAADDGWVLAADDHGTEVIPVWPHPDYARVCAVDAWANNEPTLIPLDEWLGTWTPGMVRDTRLVGVFPTPGKLGIIVAADRLRADLDEELSRIE